MRFLVIVLVLFPFSAFSDVVGTWAWNAAGCRDSSLSDLVFVSHTNEGLRYNAIQASFNAGFVALGLPWRSTHILRHSYATAALMATNNISAVQASLGHTSSKMTERYAKVIALLDRGVAEKTSKLLSILGDKEEVKEVAK